MASVEALPHAVLLRIFELLPLDTRLRCVEVCRGWRESLQDTEAWRHLVLPFCNDPRVQPIRLLRAAVARTGGRLETLDLSAVAVEPAAVAEVLHNRAQELRQLRFLPGRPLSNEEIMACMNAAPQLQLFSCAVRWSDHSCEVMLRNEPPYEAVRICTLVLDDAVVDFMDDDRQDAIFEEIRAVVKQHTHVEFNALQVECPLDASIVQFIADLADAHEHPLRVLGLEIIEDWPRLDPAIVVRLLRINAPFELRIGSWGVDLAYRGEETQWLQLCDAVRDCTSLHTVKIDCRLAAVCWRSLLDLLTALVGHAHVACILPADDYLAGFLWSPLTAIASSALGQGLAALVVANAAALHTLSICDLGLDEAGLAQVLRVLPRNTHLRDLTLGWRDDCSDYEPERAFFSFEFTDSELIPAVQQNRSLRHLTVKPDWHQDSEWCFVQDELEELRAVRAAETLVRDRSDPAVLAAARGWLRAYRKWTSPRPQP